MWNKKNLCFAILTFVSFLVVINSVSADVTTPRALSIGETYRLDVDAHTGDEATTQPKTDAHDGLNGDNIYFRRYNVARAHNDYWYTSAYQEPGEPDPSGQQWVDYEPPLTILGPGTYTIEAQYRDTASRATYNVSYTIHHEGGTTTIYQNQSIGDDTSYYSIDLGTYNLGQDGWVRVEDPGSSSITFNRMRFTYEAPAGLSIDGNWIKFRGEKSLLIGDSVTQGWMECGTNFDHEAYVDALASRGINILMIWSYIATSAATQTGDARIGYDSPEYSPWVKNGSSYELDNLNQAYFDALEALVSYADDNDIVVLITIHDGWTKTRFADHPFNTTKGGPLTSNGQYVELYDYNSEMPTTYNASWNYLQKNQYYQEKFVNALVNAVGSYPNVIFEMFNEGEWYNQTYLRAHQVHFLDFIKARTDTLTMVNDDHVGGTNFRGEADCDIISLHKPNWDEYSDAIDAFGHYDGEFTATPTKPVFFGEPVPEWQGESYLIDAMMRLMWGTAVAGCGYVVQNDASFGFDPYANMASEAYDCGIMLDREGYCAVFFNDSGIELSGMSPDGSLASTGVCLADTGREYVVYSQSGSSFTVNLSAASGETLNCRFYNPRTGVFESTFQRSGGSSAESFTKPSSSDWVLHITSSVSSLAPAIVEVTPDPDTNVYAGREYTKQLQLQRGSAPITWSVEQGPAELQVNSSGYVYDWIPGGCDVNTLITIEIEAQNSYGSDTETWQVQPQDYYLADYVVDFNDLAVMADEWLLNDGNLVTDLDCSSSVDFYDYAMLANEWGQEQAPPDLEITNLDPSSYEVSYDDLDVGELMYVDRSYTYTSVPSAYQNKTYIKTANDDKHSTDSSFMTFDINRDASVYVAHDDRLTTKPSWLGSFTDTGDDLIDDGEYVHFSLYKKDFSTGTVTLGGNEGGGQPNCGMYTVVVIEK